MAYRPHRGRSPSYRGFNAGTKSGCLINVLKFILIISLIVGIVLYIL